MYHLPTFLAPGSPGAPGADFVMSVVGLVRTPEGRMATAHRAHIVQLDICSRGGLRMSKEKVGMSPFPGYALAYTKTGTQHGKRDTKYDKRERISDEQ